MNIITNIVGILTIGMLTNPVSTLPPRDMLRPGDRMTVTEVVDEVKEFRSITFPQYVECRTNRIATNTFYFELKPVTKAERDPLNDHPIWMTNESTWKLATNGVQMPPMPPGALRVKETTP